MKRSMAPRFWKIERKTKKFAIRPRPGPHAKDMCIPVGIILRDILHYARTAKEAREILNRGLVKIDNKTRKEYGFPAGLMDVVSIQDEHYRILPNNYGLCLQKIDRNDSTFKLLKITNKKFVSGKVQLNFHDGKNLLLDKDNYKTNDVAVFDLEKNAIRKVIGFKKGSAVIVTGGNSIGSTGIIADINIRKSSMPNEVIVRIGNRKVPLPVHYVFVIGEEKPEIAFGE